MTPEEMAFRQAIIDNPDDDAHRLIFADWLEERGDPRAEFIRVQCELARLPKEAERRWGLEGQELTLLNTQEKKWRAADLGAANVTVRGEFRRGLVETVAMSAAT